jgi:cation diffusion facilitator CzcD-associated flavoprotein CzcO
MKIVIVGAGAAGLAMAARLKRAGYRDFTIVERSPAIGGTWHDNRYPGCGCDVPSHLYSFSFAPNADWTYKFSRQPEIEKYLTDLVEREGLAEHLQLGTEVHGAAFDGTWRVRTSAGELACDVLITGTGQLNRPKLPGLPGEFDGLSFHSARWDPSFDPAGKRVVVIGNGASAAQIVPAIAPHVAKLTLLQRTPAYVFPRGDRAYSRVEKWLFRNVPGWRRSYRSFLYWQMESRFSGLKQRSLIGKLVSWLCLRHLRKQIRDPALRATLTPAYPAGCKRIVISDDWYPTLARDNVAVVTSAIDRLVPEGVLTADGVTHAADAIIYATGFESTGFLVPMKIVANGVELTDAWRHGAEAHNGVMVSGFPNLMLLYGPNTNLGHSSILFMIECQVRYVLGLLAGLEHRNAHTIEVKRTAMERSNRELQASLANMTWAAGCNNWYRVESGKNTNNWAGHTTSYWWRTRKPDLREFDLR